MSSHKINKSYIEIVTFAAVVIILLLSALNIDNYLKPVKVLGIETKVNTDEVFWQSFLSKNPNYIPGWIAIGRNDVAKNIDPNFGLKP